MKRHINIYLYIFVVELEINSLRKQIHQLGVFSTLRCFYFITYQSFGRMETRNCLKQSSNFSPGYNFRSKI